MQARTTAGNWPLWLLEYSRGPAPAAPQPPGTRWPVITLGRDFFFLHGWDFESLQHPVKPVNIGEPHFPVFRDKKVEQGGIYCGFGWHHFCSKGPLPSFSLTLFQAPMQQVCLWTSFHSPSICLCHDLQKEQRWSWVNETRHPKRIKVQHASVAVYDDMIKQAHTLLLTLTWWQFKSINDLYQHFHQPAEKEPKANINIACYRLSSFPVWLYFGVLCILPTTIVCLITIIVLIPFKLQFLLDVAPESIMLFNFWRI